jgi:hypothetical protein
LAKLHANLRDQSFTQNVPDKAYLGQPCALFEAEGAQQAE